MNKGRLLLLGVAMIAGGGAFFMVAAGGDEASPVIQQVVPQETVETVRVLVADRSFSRGERLEAEATTWVKWPVDSLPPQLVTEDDEAFYASLPTMRARTTIVEGEPIIRAKLVAQGDKGMMAALLTPGMRAVSADLRGSATSSGFVLPGDRVDVMTTSNQGGQVQTRTLMSNVRVIAIDTIIAEESGPAAIAGNTVTFELAPGDVQRFINARDTSAMTLVLRSMFEGDAPESGAPAEVIVMRYGQG